MSPALLISLAFCGGVAVWVRGRAPGWRLRLLLIPLAFVCVLAGAPGVWSAALAGYPQDSFWTLDPMGRAGVVAISLVGLTAIFTLLWTLPSGPTRWTLSLRIGIGCCGGVLVYGVLYSLSPQAFYTFYQWIFPGLPQQIVVKSAFDLPRLMEVAALKPQGSLSDHLAGLGLWAVLPYTVWREMVRS